MKQILGLDPGSVNFGLTVLNYDGKKKFKVVHCLMVDKTLRDMKTGVRKQLHAYYTTIRKYSDGVDHVVCERFQNRGIRGGGSTSETINAMIGVLHTTHKDVMMITASLWKNASRRVHDLDLFYKTCAVPPHVVDSAMIALYRAQIENEEKPFSGWSSQDFKKLRSQIEKSYGRKNKLRGIRDFKRFDSTWKKSF